MRTPLRSNLGVRECAGVRACGRAKSAAAFELAPARLSDGVFS
jgi:hypothetical protein